MRPPLRTFLFLSLFSTVVQVVALARTRFPARDNIDYLRTAQILQAHGTLTALRGSIHHPFYPAMIVAAHRAAVALSFTDGVALWQRSGQIAAALPLVLLPPIVYLVGLRLFSHRVAWSTAALLAMLPVICLLGADGLTESSYLLFFFLGLWCAVEYLVRPHPGWLFGAGLASGLAYLARPEGLVLPFATVLTLAALQTRACWRTSWRQVALGSLSLVCGVLIFAAPYAAATGRITGKRSLDRILGRVSPPPTAEYISLHHRPAPTITSASPDDFEVPPPAPALVPGLEAFSFRAPAPFERLDGYGDALQEYGHEFLEATRYVFAVLALVGACVPLSPRPRPCDVLVLAILGLFSTAAVISAAHDGYIEARHLVTVVALVTLWSAHGAWRVVDWLAPWVASWCDAALRIVPSAAAARRAAPSRSADAQVNGGRLAQGIVFAVAAGVCLDWLAGPRRVDQDGHAAAARWIAANTPEDAVLLDTYGWASLLGNRESYQYETVRQAFFDPRLRWIVIEAGELQEDSERAASLRELLDLGGKLRGSFRSSDRETAGDPGKAVSVYEWSPARAAHQLALRADSTRTAKGI